MGPDSTQIKDFAQASIAAKTVHQSDEERAELTRRRKQVPAQWYPLAGNAEQAKDGHWRDYLGPGLWLKVVYQDGTVFISRLQDGEESWAVEDNTILVNDQIPGPTNPLPAFASTKILQVFTDDQEMANSVKAQRHRIEFPE